MISERVIKRIASRWKGRAFGSARMVNASAAAATSAPASTAPALWDYVAASMGNRFNVTEDANTWFVHCRRCSFAVMIAKPASGYVVTDWDFLRLLSHLYEAHGVRSRDGVERKV